MRKLLPVLFAATLFLSAFMLFWIEPLTGKMFLPLLGGTPAVWNTCLLFFQTGLLAGYLYALILSRALSLRKQITTHVVMLIIAALINLPIGLTTGVIQSVPRDTLNPAWWLFGRLTMTVGAVFFVISATNTLLQQWFAGARQDTKRDPYFLFAASNAGSLIALLAFPLILEPRFASTVQHKAWSAAYLLLLTLIITCAATVWRVAKPNAKPSIEKSDTNDDDASSLQYETPNDEAMPPDFRRRAWWVLLAFAPSSLMLGVTTYISIDIAALPLLWIVPLTLYLMTFVIAFAARDVRRTARLARLVSRGLPGAGLILVLVYLSGAQEPAWFLIGVHLVFFFVAALAAHARLAATRPAAFHLAEFYLWLSVGGALGGVFNAIIAPQIFGDVYEYPLAIVLACALRFASSNERTDAAHGESQATKRKFLHGVLSRDVLRSDILPSVVIGTLTVVLAFVATYFRIGMIEGLGLVLGVPLLISYVWLRGRVVGFALALGGVMLGSSFYMSDRTRTLASERNFFGVLRVSQTRGGNVRRLYHGTTLHGRQYTDIVRNCDPLSYYHRASPLGAIFAAFHASRRGDNDSTNPETNDDAARVAVVGLGTGAMIMHARQEEQWTFYEINPTIERLARDPQYFTYLEVCAPVRADTVLGDARLRLREAADKSFDMIFLDAFSSDAIPVHLLTKEAMSLYLSKLKPDGLLAFHISNRNLDLRFVLANAASEYGLTAINFEDSNAEKNPDKDASEWMAMTRNQAIAQNLLEDKRAERIAARPRARVWSDDFTNIFEVLK
ncbi:MAG: fused MFS/spermidine synthase [Pyrinomonadaceae bacterium MAG19_C2-C3]|nr:fused MFS/spermidine synthase [Pyrinomonadaceae bacterium MAG19_C2-C3]